MADLANNIRCLLVPLLGETMLVPNAAVAEIVEYVEPEVLPDSPDWLLGMIPWRAQVIPVMSFEGACGRGVPTRDNARIAVFNTMRSNRELQFYGVMTQGFPSLVRVGKGEVSPAPVNSANLAGPISCRVIWNGTPAIIPNLDAMESMLVSREAV